MIVVTAGNKYLDIDAYASCVAYVKLLKSRGEDAVFASSATPNSSVSSIVRKYDHMIRTDYVPTSSDEFIVLDVSNPQFIDKLVNQDKIVEIIDHHTGFESAWNKDGRTVQIEFIGSVATIILEKIIKEKQIDVLDRDLCKLLLAAVLDNTLNLKGSITTKRDLQAYETLKRIGCIDKSFEEEYFMSCQKEINDDVVGSIKKDVKIETVADLLPSIFGQLTLYDTKPIFDRKAEICEFFKEFNQPWILNVICIKDGKSYIISSEDAMANIQTLFNKKFNNDVLILSKYMLRKEIMKMAREKCAVKFEM